MSKGKAQEAHASRRFAERFGVKLSQFVWDGIIHQIRNRKAVFFKKQSNRISIFDVTVVVRERDIIDDRAKPGPLAIRVVYDKERKNLVSILTLDMDCELELVEDL